MSMWWSLNWRDHTGKLFGRIYQGPVYSYPASSTQTSTANMPPNEVFSTTNPNSPRQETNRMPIKSKMDLYCGVCTQCMLCVRIRTHKPHLTEHNQESSQAETTLRMSRMCSSVCAEHKTVQTNLWWDWTVWRRVCLYYVKVFFKRERTNSRLKEVWNLESVPSESFASSTREENANINVN